MKWNKNITLIFYCHKDSSLYGPTFVSVPLMESGSKSHTILYQAHALSFSFSSFLRPFPAHADPHAEMLLFPQLCVRSVNVLSNPPNNLREEAKDWYPGHLLNISTSSSNTTVGVVVALLWLTSCAPISALSSSSGRAHVGAVQSNWQGRKCD